MTPVIHRWTRLPGCIAGGSPPRSSAFTVQLLMLARSSVAPCCLADGGREAGSDRFTASALWTMAASPCAYINHRSGGSLSCSAAGGTAQQPRPVAERLRVRAAGRGADLQYTCMYTTCLKKQNTMLQAGSCIPILNNPNRHPATVAAPQHHRIADGVKSQRFEARPPNHDAAAAPHSIPFLRSALALSLGPRGRRQVSRERWTAP